MIEYFYWGVWKILDIGNDLGIVDFVVIVCYYVFYGKNDWIEYGDYYIILVDIFIDIYFIIGIDCCGGRRCKRLLNCWIGKWIVWCLEFYWIIYFRELYGIFYYNCYVDFGIYSW